MNPRYTRPAVAPAAGVTLATLSLLSLAVLPLASPLRAATPRQAVTTTAPAAAAPPASAKPEDAKKEEAAKAILARTVLRYRSFPSLEQTVKGQMTVEVQQIKIVADIVNNVRMAQPNRFRLDTAVTFQQKTERGIVTSDGTTVWESDPKAKRHTEASFASIAKDEDALSDWITDRFTADVTPLFFLKAAGGPFDQITQAEMDAVDVSAHPTETLNGEKVHVVNAGSDRDVLLYIGEKDRLVKRCVLNLTEKDGTKIRFVLDYGDLKTGRAIPASEFRFDATGSAKAEKLDTPFDRLFAD